MIFFNILTKASANKCNLIVNDHHGLLMNDHEQAKTESKRFRPEMYIFKENILAVALFSKASI